MDYQVYMIVNGKRIQGTLSFDDYKRLVSLHSPLFYNRFRRLTSPIRIQKFNRIKGAINRRLYRQEVKTNHITFENEIITGYKDISQLRMGLRGYEPTVDCCGSTKKRYLMSIVDELGTQTILSTNTASDRYQIILKLLDNVADNESTKTARLVVRRHISSNEQVTVWKRKVFTEARESRPVVDDDTISTTHCAESERTEANVIVRESIADCIDPSASLLL